MKTNNRKLIKLLDCIPEIARWLYIIFLGLTFILIIAVAPFHKHRILPDLVRFNFLYILIALFLGTIISFLLSKKTWKIKNFKLFLLVGTIILGCLQLYVIYGKFFIAGWDVATIFFPLEDNNQYFSYYPNNMFLKGFFTITLNCIFVPLYNLLYAHIPMLNDITANSLNYIFAVLISSVTVLFTVFFTTLIIKKIININAAIITFIFSAIFIGLSPWLLVPYSDNIMMFLTTLLLYSVFCLKNKYTKTILVASILIVGFNIKPTIIFAYFGLGLIFLIKFIKSKKLHWKNYLKTITTFSLTLILCVCCTTAIKDSTDLEIDKDKERTMTHFLMMGLYPEGEGVHTETDDAISNSAGTVKERQELNIKTTKEYLEQMGPIGTLKLFAKKTMENYGDGSFMWERDGSPYNFYRKKIGHDPFIVYVYDHYYPIAQILWLMVLAGSFISILNKKQQDITKIICITLLCHSIFLMIFECGSRYLIQYLSYFIILSVFGWQSLTLKTKKIKVFNEDTL